MGDARFWIVWCPEKGVPAKKHHTKDEAIAEAQRLARKTPENFMFYVMEAVGVAFRPELPVEYGELPDGNVDRIF